MESYVHMKKRLFSLILTLVLCFCITAVSLAEGEISPETGIDTTNTPHYIVIDANDVNATSPIYEKAADEQVFPASTTKMLTSIIAIENMPLETEITVGSEILGLFELKHGYTPTSSLMGLKEGETVTLKDLLHGLLLVSGNDAADAIAVAVAGSVDNFVQMMNTKAQELGMTNSHFVNPNGVHNDNHYSTARDMAKLAAYCMQNPTFAAIVATPQYTIPANNVIQEDTVITNSNYLLTAAITPQYSSLPYEYCIGIKTGYTEKSGNCLVAGAEKNGAKAIVCIYEDELGKMSNHRFTLAKEIFEDLFNDVYMTVSGTELNLQNTFTCPISEARPEDLDENGEISITVDTSGLSITGLPDQCNSIKHNPEKITADVEWTDSLKAPIRQGQQLGTVSYKYEGKTIYTVALTSPVDVMEVAVVSGQDSSADSLLTNLEPVETSQPATETADKESSSTNPILIIVLVLLGIIVLFIIVFLVRSIIKKKKKEKRRKEMLARKRAQQRQNGTRTSGTYSRNSYDRQQSANTRRSSYDMQPSANTRRNSYDIQQSANTRRNTYDRQQSVNTRRSSDNITPRQGSGGVVTRTTSSGSRERFERNSGSRQDY